MTKTTDIANKVETLIETMRPGLPDKVADYLANLELDKCSDYIVKAYNMIADWRKALKKLTPDVGGSFDADGVETKPTLYSKQRHEERKKLNEKIERLDRLVEQGFNGVTDKLYEFVNKNGEVPLGD